ncbi:MAG: hypothetical protein QOI95_768 [Acidimicrobiaceae bacterium]|jgi:undecaprenyl-diphosphatase
MKPVAPGNLGVMIRRAAAVSDQLALRHVAKSIPEPVASTVDTVGRAASGGGLWVGCAALLAVCGSKGRHAAGRGLIAYGAASLLATGPAKWVSRRKRPSGLLLKDLPRLGGQPKTSSFPSSHTASATAFAVAASAALPVAAPLLGPLAATVALSRVKAVRHFPTDVIAGAALGLAVGAAVHFKASRGNAGPSSDAEGERNDAA